MSSITLPSGAKPVIRALLYSSVYLANWKLVYTPLSNFLLNWHPMDVVFLSVSRFCCRTITLKEVGDVAVTFLFLFGLASSATASLQLVALNLPKTCIH